METIKAKLTNLHKGVLAAIIVAILTLVSLTAWGLTSLADNDNQNDDSSSKVITSITPTPSVTPSPTKSASESPTAEPEQTVVEEQSAEQATEAVTEPVEEQPAEVAEPAPAEAPAGDVPVARPGDTLVEGAIPEAVGPIENQPVNANPEQPANPGPLTGMLVYAGDSVTTGGPYSGSGTVTVSYTRDPNSAAPNLPVYTSMLCDGASVYSGAQNATPFAPVEHLVPYAGANCVLKTKVAYPSAQWNGTHAAVYVRVGAPQGNAGAPSVTESGFISTPVVGTQSFSIASPAGLNNGMLTVKLTACSSRGGTSDVTRQFGCDGFVQNGVGSGVTITASDANGFLGSTDVWVTPESHHSMATIGFNRQTVGAVTMTVTHTGGSAMLVHGPGTRVTGTL